MFDRLRESKRFGFILNIFHVICSFSLRVHESDSNQILPFCLSFESKRFLFVLTKLVSEQSGDENPFQNTP